MSAVRSWVSERRQSLGMSQADLATQLQIRGFDISRATISHWEMGKYHPPINDPEFVRALADILRVSVVMILRQSGYDLSPDVYSENAKQAAKIIDEMPPEAQKTALNILRALRG